MRIHTVYAAPAARISGGLRGALRAALVLAVLGTVIGCYSPLNSAELQADLTLDVSGLITALPRSPGQEEVVMDIFLFRPEDVTYDNSFVTVSSREDSIPINGQRYERIVLAPDVFWVSPDDQGDGQTSDRARISGIPEGGPYVMLVLVGEDGIWGVWLTARGDDQLVTFTIRGGETTRLGRADIMLGLAGEFEEENELFGQF